MHALPYLVPFVFLLVNLVRLSAGSLPSSCCPNWTTRPMAHAPSFDARNGSFKLAPRLPSQSASRFKSLHKMGLAKILFLPCKHQNHLAPKEAIEVLGVLAENAYSLAGYSYRSAYLEPLLTDSSCEEHWDVERVFPSRAGIWALSDELGNTVYESGEQVMVLSTGTVFSVPIGHQLFLHSAQVMNSEHRYHVKGLLIKHCPCTCKQSIDYSIESLVPIYRLLPRFTNFASTSKAFGPESQLHAHISSLAAEHGHSCAVYNDFYHKVEIMAMKFPFDFELVGWGLNPMVIYPIGTPMFTFMKAGDLKQESFRLPEDGWIEEQGEDEVSLMGIDAEGFSENVQIDTSTAQFRTILLGPVPELREYKAGQTFAELMYVFVDPDGGPSAHRRLENIHTRYFAWLLLIDHHTLSFFYIQRLFLEALQKGGQEEPRPAERLLPFESGHLWCHMPDQTCRNIVPPNVIKALCEVARKTRAKVEDLEVSEDAIVCVVNDYVDKREILMVVPSHSTDGSDKASTALIEACVDAQSSMVLAQQEGLVWVYENAVMFYLANS